MMGHPNYALCPINAEAFSSMAASSYKTTEVNEHEVASNDGWFDVGQVSKTVGQH